MGALAPSSASHWARSVGNAAAQGVLSQWKRNGPKPAQRSHRGDSSGAAVWWQRGAGSGARGPSLRCVQGLLWGGQGQGLVRMVPGKLLVVGSLNPFLCPSYDFISNPVFITSFQSS